MSRFPRRYTWPTVCRSPSKPCPTRQITIGILDLLTWTGATPGDDPAVATSSFTTTSSVTVSYGSNVNEATIGSVNIIPLDGNVQSKSYQAIDCTYVSQTYPDSSFPNSNNLFVNLWNQAFIKFALPYDIDPSLIQSAQILISGTAVDNETYMYLMSSNNWNSSTLSYDISNGILTDDTLIGPVSTSEPNHQNQTSTIDITSYLLSAYNNDVIWGEIGGIVYNVNQLSFYFRSSYMNASDNILGIGDTAWWVKQYAPICKHQN